MNGPKEVFALQFIELVNEFGMLRTTGFKAGARVDNRALARGDALGKNQSCGPMFFYCSGANASRTFPAMAPFRA